MAKDPAFLFEISPFGPPDSAGVYMIVSRTEFNDGTLGHERILYVGSSKCISKRVLSTNHPYRLFWNRGVPVTLKFLETEDYVNMEKRIIKHYKPILNKQYV